MSTINPSGIPLNQTTLTGRRNQTVTVTGIRKRYKIDKETQVRTEELDGFTVDVPMRNGIQSVKLPSEAMDESTFTKIDDDSAERLELRQLAAPDAYAAFVRLYLEWMEMSEDEQLDLLATDGMLVKRPILVDDDCILVGFKVKEWEDALL